MGFAEAVPIMIRVIETETSSPVRYENRVTLDRVYLLSDASYTRVHRVVTTAAADSGRERKPQT